MKYWIQLEVYNPFRIGGNVIQHFRYPVEGELHRISDFPIVIFKQSDGYWWAAEKTTGGKMVKKKSKAGLLKLIPKLIAETPDFKRQIKALPKLLDLPLISSDEAHKLMGKQHD